MIPEELLQGKLGKMNFLRRKDIITQTLSLALRKALTTYAKDLLMNEIIYLQKCYKNNVDSFLESGKGGCLFNTMFKLIPELSSTEGYSDLPSANFSVRQSKGQ